MSSQMASKLVDELRANLSGEKVGVVVVDHGSKRDESNHLLEEVVELFREATGILNVAPAHMELAKPTIADAFQCVVERGATLVIVAPFFLAPGRHWTEDIPKLASEAATRHDRVKYVVTGPLGLHEAIVGVLADRIRERLIAGSIQ